MLETLSWCLRPSITDRGHDLARAVGILFVLSVPAALLALRAKTGRDWKIIAVVEFGMILLSSCLLPSLGTAGQSIPVVPGVDLLQSGHVGNYDVDVIRTQTIDGLTDWLTRQSLRAPADAEKQIFNDYISSGWCFVVAHLRQQGGTATPHPLAISFPANEPVFPMRATALAGSTTAVELMIVADRKASADGFECVVCDTFKLGGGGSTLIRNAPPEQSKAYRASAVHLTIAQPDVMSRLWDGCVITKLSAQLRPEQMKSDVKIQLAPFDHASQQQFQTASSRRSMLLAALLLAAMGWAFISAGMRFVTPPITRKGWIAGQCIIGGIIVGTMLTIYLRTPVIPTIEARRSMIASVFSQSNRYQAIQTAARDGTLDSSMADDPQQIIEHLKAANIDHPETNLFTDRPVEFRRTPGNYFISRDESGQTYLGLVGIWGDEARILLLPPKKSAVSPTTIDLDHPLIPTD
jgi:hypothetical protein